MDRQQINSTSLIENGEERILVWGGLEVGVGCKKRGSDFIHGGEWKRKYVPR